MEITVTCKLTPHNLDVLKQLQDETIVFVPRPTGEQIAEIVKSAEAKKPAEPYVEESPHEEPKKITAADVKALCLKFSKEGRQSELKVAFAKFGAKKLTEINPDDYPALMEELSMVGGL